MSQIFATAILIILSVGILACSGSPSPSNGNSNSAPDPTPTPPPTPLSVSSDAHPGIHRRHNCAAGRHANVYCSDGKYTAIGKSGE